LGLYFLHQLLHSRLFRFFWVANSIPLVNPFWENGHYFKNFFSYFVQSIPANFANYSKIFNQLSGTFSTKILIFEILKFSWSWGFFAGKNEFSCPFWENGLCEAMKSLIFEIFWVLAIFSIKTGRGNWWAKWSVANRARR